MCLCFCSDRQFESYHSDGYSSSSLASTSILAESLFTPALGSFFFFLSMESPWTTESHRAETGHLTRFRSIPEHLRISSSDLHTGKLIGVGNSSEVKSATWLGCEVAVKELAIYDFQVFEPYPKELEILMRLPHPHVVQLLGFIAEPGQTKVSIVMERLETNLLSVMRSSIRGSWAPPFDGCEAIDIATKIALGMRFLHGREVVHGSLTGDIILMNVHTDGHLDIKIGGFAFSDHARNSSKSEDVYDFSTLCIALLLGWEYLYLLPSCTVDLEQRVREAAAKLELPPGIGDDLTELILDCADEDPENRPGFFAICDRLATIRAACDQARKQTTVTEDCALQWTTHKDDEGNKCLEIASMLETMPIHLSIDPADVEWRRPLAAGGSNEVYEVNWLGCAFAVKRFKSLSVGFREEVEFLMKLQHPHIARLIGVSVDDNGGWIMMERMDMDLRKLINSRLHLLRKAGRTSSPLFSGAESQELCLKIALGLNFLHSKNVVHRDIKAANVLVHDHCGRFDVKITDFGASHRLGNPNVAHRVGTNLWRAPEVLRAKRGELRAEQLLKTDVYSFAMTCYEILTGTAPHEHLNERDVLEKRRPELPGGLHPKLSELISKCWNDDPEVRPKFSTICDVLGSIPFGNVVPPRSRVEAWTKRLQRRSLPFSRCLGLTYGRQEI